MTGSKSRQWHRKQETEMKLNFVLGVFALALSSSVFAASDAPSGWTKCAQPGATCAMSGTHANHGQVRRVRPECHQNRQFRLLADQLPWCAEQFRVVLL